MRWPRWACWHQFVQHLSPSIIMYIIMLVEDLIHPPIMWCGTGHLWKSWSWRYQWVMGCNWRFHYHSRGKMASFSGNHVILDTSSPSQSTLVHGYRLIGGRLCHCHAVCCRHVIVFAFLLPPSLSFPAFVVVLDCGAIQI